MRERAARYLTSLLSPVGRRTGRQMAERMGEARDDGVQRLLNAARWDADAVRDDLRDYVLENLGDPSGVLVLITIGFPKKGTRSVGVERWRNPTTGRIENHQLGLFLAYASPGGWAFVDRALYLPEEWAEDEARRREAGVPDGVIFATKGELAQGMLKRAFEANAPAAWITGSEAYGTDGRLWRWLEARGCSYALAVRRSPEPPRPQGILLSTIPGWAAYANVDEAERYRERVLGIREYGRGRGRAKFLLVSRVADRTDEFILHRAYGPSQTPLSGMARVVATRQNIEAGLEQAKGEVGLDQYEVRRWEAWHRHVTLSLLAHAALQVTRARAASGGDRQGPA